MTLCPVGRVFVASMSEQTTPPLCECHGAEMYWNRDLRKTAGGYWQCAIKSRVSTAAYYKAHREQLRVSAAAYRAKKNRENLVEQITTDYMIARVVFAGNLKAHKVIELVHDGATEGEREAAKVALTKLLKGAKWQQEPITYAETPNTQPETRYPPRLASSLGG